MMLRHTLATTTLAGVYCLTGAAVSAEDYDPLSLPSTAVRATDLNVRDEKRARDIPLRLYLPEAQGPVPVVLFSHGLGGTRAGCEFLGKHWSARGYAAIFLQHAGSDDSVWRDQPLAKRRQAMNQAASAQNFQLRVRDVSAVLDQLDQWNQQDPHALKGVLDLQRVGMSGHSFGAVTTQAVSGQSFPLVGQRMTDPRIRAAIAFSPSSPRRGDPAVAFSAVKIPWLLMTGTKDVALIGDIDVASRLNVYPHLPASVDKYELVLNNAEHSAFSDRALPGDREARNPNHHRAILALSTAFWDTYLGDNVAARRWLQGAGPRAILQAEDRWQLHVLPTSDDREK